MERIVIIGAGPHGNNVAGKLAGQGFTVDVYEEHERIGIPIACTGLLSDSIGQLADVPREAINTVLRKATIHGAREQVNLRIKPNLIVDRTVYDDSYRAKAEETGARFHTGHRLDAIKGNKLLFSHAGKRVTTNASIIIGADGPTSTTAKETGLWQHRDNLIGIQARVQGTYALRIQFFPLIGTYAWIVPESTSIARIGIASHEKARETFEQFMGQERMQRIINYQAGPIPLHHPKIPTQRVSRNGADVYLVGDAAGQIKNTTGGGLIPGLIAGNTLAESISSGKDYERQWKRAIGGELWLHAAIRKTLDQFSPHDYDSLIATCKKPSVKHILEDVSRDRPSRMLPRLMLHAPGLIRFAPKARL